MARGNLETWPRRIFIACLSALALGLAFAYGAVAYKAGLPPIPQIRNVLGQVKEVVAPSKGLFETEGVVMYEPAVSAELPDALQPGLVMVAEDIEAWRKTVVRIVDRSGRTIHEWQPDWFDMWPDGEGDFPFRPKTGMYLHGVEILPDGSLVGNFEHQSTFRMNVCGDVMWKLENLGHHAVHYAEDGTLWVPAEIYTASGETGYANHKAPLRSWTMQNISLDGEVLRTIPVIDIMLKNGLEGLLYLSSLDNGTPFVSGDTLHLNDIDTFPSNLQSDIFAPGDLMISLRNINAFMVVDPETLKSKFLSIGHFVRHHDPDFLPGDRISVYDNRNFTMAPEAGPPMSRIIEIDAKTGAMTPVLDDRAETTFFTEIMGQHQRLDNGNILVVVSGEGRMIEFTSDGRVAWRYDNRVGDKNLRIYGAKVLPDMLDEDFFRNASANCQK